MAAARSRAKRFVGTVAFVIVVLVTLVFVFILYANQQNDTNLRWAQTDVLPEVALWSAIILGIMAAVLIVALLIRGYDRRGDELDEREAFFIPETPMAPPPPMQEDSLDQPKGFGQGPEVVVYNLPTVPPMYKPWEKVPKRRKSPFTYTFHFPRSVEDALYVNNYIPIDRQGNMLKLRTLLAGPKDAQKKDLPREHQFPKKTEVKATPPPPPKPAQAEASLAPAPALSATPSTPPAGDSPYKPKPIVVGAGDGREFIQELEARIRDRDAQKAEAFRAAVPRPAEAFYDYTGDVHDVEDLEGIGKIFAQKLREIGIYTTARLAYEDADRVAQEVGVPRKTVELWKSMGELIKVNGIGKQYAEALARSGVTGIAELKKRSADAIADQVNAYLSSLKNNVLGSGITAKRVEGWQKSARDMRRVRLKVPER